MSPLWTSSNGTACVDGIYEEQTMFAEHSIELDQALVPHQRASRAGGIEIVPITRLTDVKPCEVLFIDYDDWVAAYLYDHGVVIDPTARTRAFIEHQVPELLTGSGHLYAACHNGKPVGVLALSEIDDQVAEVTRLFVRMTSRRRGIARALLNRALEDARSLGYRTLQAQMLSFMHAAQAMCETAGFKTKHQLDGLTTLMERTL
jgi:GNAT superfamily N-acetyltransferase